MAKADNMLSVLWLLSSRGRLTATKIAEELEISVRTVYRYIDSLCASGVPIIADSGHEGGYRLTDGFRGTPLFFEPTEVSAIFHATKFAQRSGYPYSNVLDEALRKLQRTLTPYQMDYLDRHNTGFGVVQSLRGGPVEQWLGVLENSVAECRTVHILYHKLDSDHAEWRTVDPYGLAFAAGVWYIAVFCHTRRAIRDFRVDRIQDISLTGDTFERPPDFSVNEHFSDHRMIEWIENQPLVSVRIMGNASAVGALCDHWFLRLCLVEQHRAEAVLQVPIEAIKDVATYLIPYGDSIQIIEPDDLRAEMAMLCNQWAKHFTENSDVH